MVAMDPRLIHSGMTAKAKAKTKQRLDSRLTHSGMTTKTGSPIRTLEDDKNNGFPTNTLGNDKNEDTRG